MWFEKFYRIACIILVFKLVFLVSFIDFRCKAVLNDFICLISLLVVFHTSRNPRVLCVYQRQQGLAVSLPFLCGSPGSPSTPPGGDMAAQGEAGAGGLLAPSPQSEAVTHEMEELSLQPSQNLPPLNERKNGESTEHTCIPGAGKSVSSYKILSIWG